MAGEFVADDPLDASGVGWQVLGMTASIGCCTTATVRVIHWTYRSRHSAAKGDGYLCGGAKPRVWHV
jgi:hypothetical protein